MKKSKQPYDNSRSAWDKRFAAAEKHADGVRGYCEESGIRLDRYYYWRRRLKIAAKADDASAAIFARVEVEESATARPGKLPDPKWLAEFLLALGSGS